MFLLASIIDAAPKPNRSAQGPINNRKRGLETQRTQNRGARKTPLNVRDKKNTGGKAKRQFPIIFQGSSVYPNYYIQHSSALTDFQNSFLQAAFLSGVHYHDLEKYSKQNLTDSNGTPLPLDAKTSAAFEAAFGDQKGDVKGATDLKAKIITVEGLGNINIVNPFLSAKDFDGKLLKADGGLSGIKVGKLGDANSSVVALISPFQGGRFDAVFGPEIAPRYEIHYSPQGITLDPLPPFSSSAIGVAPVGPAALSAVGPAAYGLGPFSGFGIAPSFNALLHPYPYPLFPGFNPKNLKPNGKGHGGNKEDTTEQ